MPRPTSTGSAITECAFSNAIAWSIDVSPIVCANPKAIKPPARPESSPRPSRRLIIELVAGEGEEVAAVVHELVQVAARDDRGRALLDADEVDQREEKRQDEDRPARNVAQRDNRDLDRG